MLTGRAGPASRARTAAAVLAIMAGAAIVLLLMGRVPLCACGTVKLWYPLSDGPETSQHIADWYSPSHLVHGILFYAATRAILPRRTIGLRLVAAALVEAAWEILENTNRMIDRYRSATIAIGYTGDSVLNSMSDIGFMLLGFGLASRLPAPITLLLALALEALAAAVIRDNLALNVLMLIRPLDAVRYWQAGG